MSTNFSFNSKTHIFWEIYNAIKKYYPIGIFNNEGKGIYAEYDGLKLLKDSIVENIHNKEEYNKNWVSFEESLAKKYNKKIVGTTYGQAPSFSSSVILKKEVIENCTYSQELHFSVSLLGKFYQIYGVDETTIQHGIKRYTSTNVVTLSPFEEFEEPFKFIQKEIEKRFSEYRIVPFFVSKMIIEGLEVHYLNDKNCSVNKALFNDFLDKRTLGGFTKGDALYGSDKWRID